jgi:hypothetical protein
MAPPYLPVHSWHTIFGQNCQVQLIANHGSTIPKLPASSNLHPMKHKYSKTGAVSVPSTTVWVPVPLGYCCLYTLCPKNFKKKNHFLSFFLLDVTKIDKSSGGSGNMNFRCNYMDVHFFHLGVTYWF